jgi:hypothetical protein
MTLWRGLAAGAVAALAVLAWTASARAEAKTLRLGYNSAAPTMNLKLDQPDDDDDTLLVHRGYRGFYGGYGHYRGYYGGYGGYGHYHARYYGGYYGGYGGYRARYYGGYYPRYYGGYYGGGYYPGAYALSLGFYRPYSYYYAAPAYYSPLYYSTYSYYDPYYCPIGLGGSSMPYADGLGNGGAYPAPGNGGYSMPGPGNGGSYQGPAPSEVAPNPTPARPGAPANGTYPYDGGPQAPVPMPKTEPAPSGLPKAPAVPPAGERIVSLPLKPAAPKYGYAAFGEQPGKASASEDRTLVIKTEQPAKHFTAR